MATLESVNNFLAQKKIAIAGVSRGNKKFGNLVFRDLKSKGYQIYAVNPNSTEIAGEECFPNLQSLPENVDGVLIITPPQQTEQIVLEAAELGIKNIWIQQGAESETAINICKEKGITPIYGECILMFAEPLRFFHKPHRWIWKIIGKFPK